MSFSLRRCILVVSLVTLFASAAAAAARADEVIFNDGDRVTGTVTKVGGGKITIEGTKFGTVTADVKDVRSFTGPLAAATQATQPTTLATTAPTTRPTTVAAAAPPPPPAPKADKVKRWSGSVLGSAIVSRGNSESETYRVNFDATRKGDNNTLTLSAGYAFGRSEERSTGDVSTTADNWFGQAKVDHQLGERWYDYALVRVEADYVADLDVRVSPGVGIGYRWIKLPDMNFNTEAGINWVYEQYDNDGHDDHFAVRLAYHLDKKINDKVSFVHNLEYLPSVQDLGDFNLNVDAGLRITLTQRLFADLKAEWRHDASPAPGAEENDLRYTVGVGYKW
jgi:putative salt-induced outer membrane protein YdiY